MGEFWQGRRVAVLGGAGFIGSHLTEMLVDHGARVRVVDDLSNGRRENLASVLGQVELVEEDLRRPEGALRAVESQEIVLNLAARVAGIDYNRLHPGTMFRDNVLLALQVLEACRERGVERVLVVSSACVYRRDCSIPTPENEGFVGEPEPTNDGYGWAKRVAEVQARAYAREFGMKIAIARPYNAYGPRDHFDERAHVIPALIRRVFAGEDPLVVWGTGEQSRAFIYATDFARGLLEITEKYAEADPVNVGTREEVAIRDLVDLLLELAAARPRVVFDAGRPSGQPRRSCDTTKLERTTGYRARVPLRQGLAETIAWYRSRAR